MRSPIRLTADKRVSWLWKLLKIKHGTTSFMTMEVMIVSFHNACIEQRTGVKAEYNCILTGTDHQLWTYFLNFLREPLESFLLESWYSYSSPAPSLMDRNRRHSRFVIRVYIVGFTQTLISRFVWIAISKIDIFFSLLSFSFGSSLRDWPIFKWIWSNIRWGRSLSKVVCLTA